MEKDLILLFGMIIEADIYADGHGTREDDHILLKEALHKVYGNPEGLSEEELQKLEDQLSEDKKELTKRYREKVRGALKNL